MESTNKKITRQTPFEELPELLRPTEVTCFLGLGRNAIYEAIKSGEIPHQRIGGILFIPKRALAEEVVVG